MNSPFIRNFIFFAIIFAHIAFSFHFNWPIANIYKSIKYNYDQIYEGTVISTKVYGGNLRSCSRIKVSYRYEINETPYFSSELWNKSTCKNEESIREFLSLTENQKINVYSSEKNPDHSVLKVVTPSIWQWLIPIFFTGFIIWIFPPALPRLRRS